MKRKKVHCFALLLLICVLCFLSPAWAVDRGPINSGETKIGLNLSAPSYMDTWTVPAGVNDQLVVNAVTTTGTLDTCIVLYPPGGGAPEANTCGSCAWASGCDLLDVRLKASGEYTVMIRDNGLATPGTYNVSLLTIPGAVSSAPDPDGGPMASGQTLDGIIDVASDMDAFQTYGNLGDRAVVAAVTTTGSLDTCIVLFPPGGGAAEASTCGRCAWASGCDQLDLQLKATGLYTIMIRDNNLSAIGKYQVSLLKIPGVVSSASDPDGGPIASGETLTGIVNVASDMDAFQTYGNLGDRAVVAAVTTTGSLDTCIVLYPPGGGAPEANTCGSCAWASGCDQLDLQLKATGLYTIVIRDNNLSAIGSYNVSLSKIPSTRRPGLYNPSPGIGAFVDTAGTFGWDAVEGASCYDLYFGEDVVAPLAKIGDCLALPTMPFPPLVAGKIYYWHVVAHTPTGDIDGPYWWFDTGWCEDFEEYPPYPPPNFPSGRWHLLGDGEDPAKQFVGSDPAGSGGKALHLQGSSNMAASAYRAVGLPSSVKLGASIYIDTPVTPGPYPLATFNLRDHDTGTTYGGVQFRRDGKIYAVRNNLTGDVIEVGNFNPYQWYRVEMYIDLCAMQFSVYVDGELRLSGIDILATGAPNCVLVAAPMDATAWFDDVCIGALGVNHAPSFSKGDDQEVQEDPGARTVPGWAADISLGRPEDLWQVANFIVTRNSNPALFAAGPAVDASTGDLTYTPATNENGCATIEIHLHDNGGTCNGGVDTSPPETFEICVTPVNDAPSFTKGRDPVVALEDAGAVTEPGWAMKISRGADNESAQVLTFNITVNTNSGLFAIGPAIDPVTGNLTFTPAANANGSAMVTITLSDNGGTDNGGVDTSPPETFIIIVLPVEPILWTGNGNFYEFVRTALTWHDAKVAAESRIYQGVSGHLATISSVEENEFIRAAFTTGSTEQFAWIGGSEPADDGVWRWAVGPEAGIEFSDRAVPTPPFNYANWGGVEPNDDKPSEDYVMFNLGASFRSIAPGQWGDASPTPSLSDPVVGYLVEFETRAVCPSTVAVTASSSYDMQLPHYAYDCDLSTNWNSGAFTGSITVEFSGPINFRCVVLTANALPAADEDYTISGSNDGSLWTEIARAMRRVESPNPNYNTLEPITFPPVNYQYLRVDVDGGSTWASLNEVQLCVAAANDAPSFTKGDDQEVPEDQGTQTVLKWATDISAGPLYESWQVVDFIVTRNSNPALFAAGPAVDASTGDLTYTPAANANGCAAIEIRLHDNGGTAYGGVDTGHPEEFTICVTPVPDPPVADAAVDPNPVPCPQSVVLDGRGSYHPDADRTIVRYEWDFEYDGVDFEPDAIGQSVDHTYGEVGEHTAALRVTDDNVPARTSVATVAVGVGVSSPIASAGGPYSLTEGQGLVLNAAGSGDPDWGCGDAVVTYAWDLDADGDFDDGEGRTLPLTWDEIVSRICGGACDLPSYMVKVMVRDRRGLSAENEAAVTITPLDRPVRLTSPNGGGFWGTGEAHAVSWISAPEVDSVRVYLSTNGKDGWMPLFTAPAAEGSHDWTPDPDKFKKTKHGYKIKILALDAARKVFGSDTSDRPFGVGPLDVTIPDGGEELAGGDISTVGWNSHGMAGQVARTRIKYTLDGGKHWRWERPVTGEDRGSYEWQVPLVAKTTSKCRVAVFLYDAAGELLGTDQSQGWFSVYGKVELTAPENGEAVYAETSRAVRWVTNTGDAVASVLLRYKTDGERSWKTLADIPGNPGVFFWDVPAVAVPRNKCRVWIALKDATGRRIAENVGEGYFNILPKR